MNGSQTDLVAERAELLALLLDDAGLVRHGPEPPLAPRGEGVVPPLSFAQQRLWVLDRMQPGDPAYNVAVAVRLVGELDRAALGRSLDEIVARHESLRTVFPAPMAGEADEGGEPCQLVLAPREVPLSLLAPPADVTDPAAWSAERIVEEARRPFALESGPLLRCLLIQLAPRLHLFVATAHHIVADGWSMGIMTGELTALYTAFAGGRPSPLAPLPLQYGDFALWQRARTSPEARAREAAWWRLRLAGELPVLALPLARPRPPVASHAGASLPVAVPPELAAALRGLARRSGATLFSALLASYAAWLGRATLATDLVVGTAAAGRDREEVERLIGFFVHTLALRLDLAGDPAGAELLARAQAVALEAFAHEELPFDQVVEAVGPERRASHSPLFQTLLVLQSAPVRMPALPGLRIERLPVDNRTAKFDLTVKVEEAEDGGLAAVFEYSTDLLDPAAAALLAEQWLAVAGALTADPERPLSALPLLGAAERRQIWSRWCPPPVATGGAHGDGELCHRRFEAQVERVPEAPAVADEQTRRTYAELNAEANRLAHHLMSFGVGPESRVALLLGRGVELIGALLAVLKAGAAYIPLDPDQPAGRLAAMLADAEPEAVVTRGPWLEKLPPVLASRLVLLDADAAEIAAAAAANPTRAPLGANPAYVIYTSGSTGAPKGVVVSHAALSNYVAAVIDRFDLAACSSFALVSTPAADLGHTVLFPALVTGGCLHVVAHRLATDAAALGELFAREAIDCVKIVPSHLSALLLGRDAERVLPGRRLLLGGEPVARELVARLAALAPAGCRLANHYGPTETTVGAATSALHAATALGGEAALPLERPLTNVRVYVLDAVLQPVPAAMPGVLFIAGAGLARGYLNDAARTAAVFLPDPFASSPGERMYCSGDLARLRPDGGIEVAGRIDRQLKVWGFRVEPAEIEAVLERHPAVARAVVGMHDADGSGQRLVAWVVGRGAAAPVEDELRRYLAAQLPAAMVPARYVPLATLPLTANGKLDRAALPAPEGGESDAAGSCAPGAPSPVEEVVCTVLARVLRLPRVAPHESFFDLGGQSVLATQAMARLMETFQLELPVLSLFELPTAAGLARRIELGLAQAQGLGLPPLVAAGRGGAGQPLSFAQQRLWFLDQLEPGSATYNMPGRVLIRGALDVASLARSLSEIVRRHEVLRTTFPKAGGWPSQRVAEPAPVPLPCISLAALPGPCRGLVAERLALAEARRPFALARGPLLRVTLLRLDCEELLLLLTVHHIVADGWSVGIVLRELAQLYAAYRAGQPSPLPELALQYGDFAAWQRQCLRDEVLEPQIAYWRGQLAGLPPGLALPTDRPHPPLQSSHGARLSFVLPGELAERLHALGRQADVTLFMTLLAVWETLLFRYTAQPDFAVGTPISGRHRSELEELVGCFINTLVLRANLGGEPNFDALLARVRAVALGAYAHQDVPFERLIEAIEVGRDLARPPLFQTMFVWQNAPTPVARLTGLSLVPLESDTLTAKFELTLALQEIRGALHGSLEYNTDLFDAATVRRLAGHLSCLLAAVADRPALPVAALPLLSDAERAQLAEWNDTATLDPDPAGLCLHQLCERQAAVTPDAPAVIAQGRQLSFREIDAAACRLAARLRRLGVGPEVPVGICAGRSPEMVVGLLAVLKAGGAYVPLDPSYPHERLAFMAEDALGGREPRLVLTERALAGQVAGFAGPGVRRLLLDEQELGENEDERGEGIAGPAVLPEHPAYVIYTSGSTGRPKGVQVVHRAVVGLLASLTRRLRPGLSCGDTLLAVTTLSFDIAALEIFLPLATGGRLVLAPREVAHDGRRLAELVRASGATVLQATPSTWRLLLAAGWRGQPGLRMLCGGEALPRELAERLLGCGASLWNLYGPTETTIWSAVDEVIPASDPVAAGRPVADTSLHVLDDRLQPVPAGVVGEIFIGGAGLARGYLHRPELTAERFLPNPFSARGERLYRVGDLGRRRADGKLEILGRIDGQVKVQGVRIELCEIEATLARHPAVAASAVVAPMADGARRLLAYVVLRPGCAATASELRRHLAASLPSAMLPAAIVTLAELPLTPNGKLDRQALPAPEPTRPELAAAFVPPRDAVERTLTEIWTEVLPVDRVGIHDDFFELGGNSLLAVRLMALVERRLGVELPLSSLFRGATVARLAQLLAEPADEELWSPLVTIQPAGSRPPFFCVHPTGGDVLCYEPLARLLGPDQPFFGLQARGLDGRRPALRDVREMAALYLRAVRAAQPEGAYRLGGWSFGGLVAYEMAQQLRQGGGEVALLAIFDSLAPIGGSSRTVAELGHEHWASWFMLLARELERHFALSLSLSLDELLGLAPESQLEAFLAHLAAVSFLPAASGVSSAHGFRRVHEGNTVALWDYAARAVPYPGRIALFSSVERSIVGDSWAPAAHDRPDLGWSVLAGGSLDLYPMPGSHDDLLRSPNVEVVARQLAACLAPAAGRR
ncbi:MAG TPA: amino acid adenylation domain-containing protein [Thermoanaerobaculia bacterium]|nr:amino acid adenylation domain-containing protein [Thermoanaerobaculia bacterium]